VGKERDYSRHDSLDEGKLDDICDMKIKAENVKCNYSFEELQDFEETAVNINAECHNQKKEKILIEITTTKGLTYEMNVDMKNNKVTIATGQSTRLCVRSHSEKKTCYYNQKSLLSLNLTKSNDIMPLLLKYYIFIIALSFVAYKCYIGPLRIKRVAISILMCLTILVLIHDLSWKIDIFLNDNKISNHSNTNIYVPLIKVVPVITTCYEKPYWTMLDIMIGVSIVTIIFIIVVTRHYYKKFLIMKELERITEEEIQKERSKERKVYKPNVYRNIESYSDVHEEAWLEGFYVTLNSIDYYHRRKETAGFQIPTSHARKIAERIILDRSSNNGMEESLAEHGQIEKEVTARLRYMPGKHVSLMVRLD